MDTRLIPVYNIKDINLSDYIIIKRMWITQKYFDTIDDNASFYHQEGIITEINIINNNLTLDNKFVIELESHDYSVFFQKKVDVIIID